MPNTAPVLSLPVPDRVVAQGAVNAGFRVLNFFYDPEDQPLTFTATLFDGLPLPGWITFDPAIARFSFNPPADFLGTLDIAVHVSDGELSTVDDFILTVMGPNIPPVVAMPIPDRNAVVGEHFRFRISDGVFVDPEDTAFTYIARLDDGSPIPGWITFDNDGLFDGTPDADSIGTYHISVTATDGGSPVSVPLSVSAGFTLIVGTFDAAPVAPFVANPTLAEESVWQFQVPEFPDSDSTGLVYKASLAGGMPLPAWLSFDAVTRTFSGTPPQDFTGDVTLAVTADDGSRDATTIFTLIVTNVEDAPRLIIPLADMSVQEDMPFAFGRNTQRSFFDPDGDPLTFTATLANGDPLPAWLNATPFGAIKVSFNGTPPANFTGTIPIRITASDGQLTGSGVFNLRVVPTNDAPQLVNQTPSQPLLPGQAFRFHVPDNTFTDVDSPVLTYAAAQVGGEALPAWVHFDPATRDFFGTPPLDFQGLGVQVTARDEITTVAESFAFASSAPLLLNPIADQTVVRDNPWVFTVPADSFFDADTPDLTYSATLADGTPLPGWISFSPANHRFTGLPPADWAGHSDIRVTVSDGQSQASDIFAVNALGDFSFKLTGSSWGRDAPAEIHYRFDPLYYAISNSWGVGFEQGFRAGPVYGGVSGSISFGYSLQAGLLLDFALRPDSFDIEADFRIVETRSSAAQAIGTSPWVMVTGDLQYSSHMMTMGNPNGFELQAFAGIAAKIGVTIKGGIYGGFETPDITIPFIGTISIPDITFDAGFEKFLGLPEIQKITVSDGNVTIPEGGLTGAVEVDVKSGDPAYDLIKILHLDRFADLGSLTFSPPSGINFGGFEIEPSATGVGTMHSYGLSAPIIEAGLDVDQFVVELIRRTSGFDISKLFHFTYGVGGPGFDLNLKLDTDFALIGDLRLREDLYFTPQINAVLHTSYGETVTGPGGQKLAFHTPEGEGEFTVDASYTSQGQLVTQLSLVGTLHFDMNILQPGIDAAVNVGPISFSLPVPELPSVYKDSLNIVGFTAPFYTARDLYDLDQTRQDSFVLSYETFRTTMGSGDSFTLTTHQDSAEGNSNANHIIGNGRNNTIDGGGANDTLDGGGGDDRLIGNTGNDQINGGDGTDTAVFFFDIGQYRMGRRDGVMVVDGPDGQDQLTSIELLQFGSGLFTPDSLAAQFEPLVYLVSDGTPGYVLPSLYSGPVSWLQDEVLGSAGSDTAFGTARNDFFNLLGGNDAVDAGDGDDVIDGGTGSNFLTGGAGKDVFFLDGRGGGATWSTITDWQADEQLSLFGWRPGVSQVLWLDQDGAAGFQGVTMHADLDGNGFIETSVTWAGKTHAQLPTPLEYDGLLWFV